MWKEIRPNGKCKYIERYLDPVTLTPKKVSVTLDKDTKSNQKLAYKELQDRIASLVASNGSKINLKSLAKSYYTYQEKMVKINTATRNKGVLERLIKIIGANSLVDNLTVGYIEQRLFTVTSDPVTLNGYYTRLRAMFRWGFDRELHDNYRITKLKPFPEEISKKERIQDKYLEQEELTELIDGLNEIHWSLITRFLVLSGLRIGEFCALNDEDVDIDNRVIKVYKTYNFRNNIIQSAKTLESNRDVYMQDELIQVVKEIKHYMKLCRVSVGFRNNIFFSLNGERMKHDAYNKYLKENSERILGKRVTPHTLRHTHASLLAAKGMSIDSIQRRLGHSNSKVTKEVYIHITSELKKQDAEAIQQIKFGI